MRRGSKLALPLREGESSGAVMVTGMGVGGVAPWTRSCRPPAEDAKLEPELEVSELLESILYWAKFAELVRSGKSRVGLVKSVFKNDLRCHTS